MVKLYAGTIGVHQVVTGQHDSGVVILLQSGKAGLVPTRYLNTRKVLTFSNSAFSIMNSTLSMLLA